MIPELVTVFCFPRRPHHQMWAHFIVFHLWIPLGLLGSSLKIPNPPCVFTPVARNPECWFFTGHLQVTQNTMVFPPEWCLNWPLLQSQPPSACASKKKRALLSFSHLVLQDQKSEWGPRHTRTAGWGRPVLLGWLDRALEQMSRDICCKEAPEIM